MHVMCIALENPSFSFLCMISFPASFGDTLRNKLMKDLYPTTGSTMDMCHKILCLV